MRQKLINIGALVSFLICYMEWGHDRSAFVFQTEYDLLFSQTLNKGTYLHPFILIPFCGQLLLLFTLFQKKASKILSTIGILLMGVLVLFLSLIGFWSRYYLMGLLTLPYLFFGVLHFMKYRQKLQHISI